MARRRWLGLVFGAACAAAVFVAYQAAAPRLGQATEAEILALVPKDLREAPPGDPAAEARLREAVALSKRPGPDMPKRLAALLGAGPWRVPARETLQEAIDRRVGLEKLGKSLRAELERIRILYLEADDRDRAAFGRTARLAFGLIDAYDHAGGGWLDAEAVSRMTDATVQTTIDADHAVGLLRADRLALLRQFPKGGVRNDHVAEAVARDFRTDTLPRLVRAASGREGLESVFREFTDKPIDAGTYDPRETVRLFVEFARAEQRSIRRGRAAVDPRLRARATALIAALPSDPPASAGLWARLRYRWAMDHGTNTLGRAWAVPAKVDPLGEACEHRGWDRDRLRYLLARFYR